MDVHFACFFLWKLQKLHNAYYAYKYRSVWAVINQRPNFITRWTFQSHWHHELFDCYIEISPTGEKTRPLPLRSRTRSFRFAEVTRWIRDWNVHVIRNIFYSVVDPQPDNVDGSKGFIFGEIRVHFFHANPFRVKAPEFRKSSRICAFVRDMRVDFVHSVAIQQ